MNPHHWGQGDSADAVHAIGQFGFTRLWLNFVWSWGIADNVDSARVLEKLGMGREDEYFKNQWWDVLLYAILDCILEGQQQVLNSAYRRSYNPIQLTTENGGDTISFNVCWQTAALVYRLFSVKYPPPMDGIGCVLRTADN